MTDLPSSKRNVVAPFFARHIGLRTCVDGILQGRFGEVSVDTAADPHVAALSVGPFVFLGGDVAHESANRIVDSWTDFRVVLVADQAWRDKVMSWSNSETSIAERHAFSSGSLNRSRLELLASRIPHGFEIRRLDPDLTMRAASEVNEDLVPDLFWNSRDDFINNGFGFGALYGGRMEGCVTSALLTDDSAGIQINTNEDHRGKGIATVLAATFLLDCMDREIEPHWDTGDQASFHLAEKLGFEVIDAYEVIEWTP